MQRALLSSLSLSHLSVVSLSCLSPLSFLSPFSLLFFPYSSTLSFLSPFSLSLSCLSPFFLLSLSCLSPFSLLSFSIISPRVPLSSLLSFSCYLSLLPPFFLPLIFLSLFLRFSSHILNHTLHDSQVLPQYINRTQSSVYPMLVGR